jgi:hypothetical protein
MAAPADFLVGDLVQIHSPDYVGSPLGYITRLTEPVQFPAGLRQSAAITFPDGAERHGSYPTKMVSYTEVVDVRALTHAEAAEPPQPPPALTLAALCQATSAFQDEAVTELRAKLAHSERMRATLLRERDVLIESERHLRARVTSLYYYRLNELDGDPPVP